MVGLALSAVLVLVAVGCASGSDLSQPAPPASADAPPPAVFVALGGIETLNSDRDDIQDNWPQIVFAESVPAGAVYVNVATENATAASVLADQVPRAAELGPTVATVWVGSADVRRGTPAESYRDQLTQVVDGLRAAGAHRVLLLTSSAAQADRSGSLETSVAEVAGTTGATLVSLGDTSDRHSDAGQRRIAEAVEAAIDSG